VDVGVKAAPEAKAAVHASRNAMMVQPPTKAVRDKATARDKAAAIDKPTALSASEQRLALAIGGYLAVAPLSERPELLFVTAQLQQRHARLADAIPTYVELVTKYPEAEVAEVAANLLLDSLKRQGKYTELAAWVATLQQRFDQIARQPAP
jgi:TolA-binding protein